MPQFPTKTALITGAAKRIGAAVARGLASEGWRVALHCRESVAEADALAREIGGQVFVRDLVECEGLISEVAEAIGGVSLLVNSASLFEKDSVEDLSAAGWDAHIYVNTRAPALLMRDFAAQPIWGDATDGLVVNIVDQRVEKLTPDFISYTASKAALWTLTQTFAQALAGRHIRVNAVAPGPVLPSPRQTEDSFARQASNVPLQHGASPDEIFEAVRFLARTKSVTGECIALDGGQHIAWKTPDVAEGLE